METKECVKLELEDLLEKDLKVINCFSGTRYKANDDFTYFPKIVDIFPKHYGFEGIESYMVSFFWEYLTRESPMKVKDIIKKGVTLEDDEDLIKSILNLSEKKDFINGKSAITWEITQNLLTIYITDLTEENEKYCEESLPP